MKNKKVEVAKKILAENEKLSAQLRAEMQRKRIFTVDVLGAPGVGKTSVLSRLIQTLSHPNLYVIEGDIESDIDTRYLRSIDIKAWQINTKGSCHLSAQMMQTALADIELTGPGILFIENIGNLICPADFEIGEDIKMLICAVTDGSDKPYKYPLAFEKASALILNKCDLKPHVRFDARFFYDGVHALNKDIATFEVSAQTGEGFTPLAEWLKKKSAVL